MITENKKATVVRPLLRPASNYTHRHTHIHGGFQSGHQAVAEVSHGHHVRWPMASRLINKQSRMEGQIRDRCGGGAGKRWVGGGENWRDDWRMMIAKCPCNMWYASKMQIMLHGAILFTHTYKKTI